MRLEFTFCRFDREHHLTIPIAGRLKRLKAPENEGG